MEINNKVFLLNKMIKNKSNILLDYISFNKKILYSEENIYDKWKEYFIRDIWDWIKFYLHIPFCSNICRYCMYNTIKLNKRWEIDIYIDNLILYLDKFKNLFKFISFNGLYVWWWTPSILSEKQMERLFGYIYKNFKFNDEYYKTIELNPSSITFWKLDILKKYWFDRISIWVQSFNKKTLEIENRIYVSDKKIKEFVDYWKKIWFSDINLDIIAWLNKEWEKEIIDNINKLYNIRPYTITIYTILKDMERSILYKKDKKGFYKNINIIYEKILKKTNILHKYYKSNWSNVLWFILESNNKPKLKKLYDAHDETIESLFWVWYKAFSNIWWIWSYEIKNFSNWNFIHFFESSNDELDTYRYLLQSFQYKIDKKDFFNKFNYNIEDKYKDVLLYLKEKWIINIDKDFITYIWDENYIWYYWLLFLDLKNIIKFIKFRFYEKK